ncbi:MAG: hypothetical protein J6T10_01450 [Methanobrevibacter sp.]|nr:hypothetical protein [Methanobrevibacter sp.]
MSIEEYNKLCNSLGLVPYDKTREETDYGYFVGVRNWLHSERFFSVCGYRAKKVDDRSWRPGSLIFYDDNGFYRDEYYTDCEKAKPALMKEIDKFKQKINEYRKRNIAMDFV